MKHHKQASLIAVVHSIKLPTLSKAGKTSLVFHLPMGGHGFDQWSGKTLPAEELLSPWTKTTEPALWSPQATTTRSPQTGTREYSSLAATGESPCSNEDPANKSIFKKQKQKNRKIFASWLKVKRKKCFISDSDLARQFTPNIWQLNTLSHGGGSGHPLQYSFLVNSTDRGDWRAKVNGVTKSWIWLSTHAQHLLVFLKN